MSSIYFLIKKEGLIKPSIISYLYFFLKLITHLNHGFLLLNSIKLMLTKITNCL